MTSKPRKKHKPEQIVAKLRDADAMLNAGKDLAAVCRPLRSARRRCTAGERSTAG
jgi:putative transposase